jgi:hypothetical protein
MKKLLLLSSVLLTTSALAHTGIGSIITEEVTPINFQEVGHAEEFKNRGKPNVNVPDPTPVPNPQTPTPTPTDVPTPTIGDRVEVAGRVISTARDLVALGEAIYTLVQKGKPSNVTEYAPISVVPRDPISKEYMDPFELEGFSVPVEKNYVTKIKDLAGKDIVVFNYRVIYSYGGSYLGTGKYLTNIILVPSSVKTSWGWDFNAKMQLSGIMNHGSKDDPVAGAMITVKYQMNSWRAAYERNDTIHITGRGELKNFSTGTR